MFTKKSLKAFATCFMLHNKGNTIPYYDEDLSGSPLSLVFINRYSYTVQCHSIFLIFKLNTLKDF